MVEYSVVGKVRCCQMEDKNDQTAHDVIFYNKDQF
jgi:hypothetical protein